MSQDTPVTMETLWRHLREIQIVARQHSTLLDHQGERINRMDARLRTLEQMQQSEYDAEPVIHCA